MTNLPLLRRHCCPTLCNARVAAQHPQRSRETAACILHRHPFQLSAQCHWALTWCAAIVCVPPLTAHITLCGWACMRTELSCLFRNACPHCVLRMTRTLSMYRRMNTNDGCMQDTGNAQVQMRMHESAGHTPRHSVGSVVQFASDFEQQVLI